jgi:hypothetical protein
MMRNSARLERLERSNGVQLSERSKAWLGQRPPLTPQEEAAEPVRLVDLATLPKRLRDWLAL